MLISQHQFQDDFIRALYAPEAAENDSRDGEDSSPLSISELTSQPGFKVYRNTVLKASVDALAANYPTIVQLVGEQWFRAAALLYVRAEPPGSVCLIEYGESFPDFLHDFPSAAELTYLSDVARLDRCWTECHIAANEVALDPATLGSREGDDLLQSNLRPRACVRWWSSSSQPAYSIWQAHRAGQAIGDDLTWQGEAALLSRIDGQVVWQAVSEGTCLFLATCAQGQPLQAALAAAMELEPALDVAALISNLLGAQVFALSQFTPH